MWSHQDPSEGRRHTLQHLNCTEDTTKGGTGAPTHGGEWCHWAHHRTDWLVCADGACDEDWRWSTHLCRPEEAKPSSKERGIHASDPWWCHAQTQRFHSLHEAGHDVGLLATPAGWRDGKADHIHDTVWPVLLSPPALRNLIGSRSVPENNGEHSQWHWGSWMLYGWHTRSRWWHGRAWQASWPGTQPSCSDWTET